MLSRHSVILLGSEYITQVCEMLVEQIEGQNVKVTIPSSCSKKWYWNSKVKSVWKVHSYFHHALLPWELRNLLSAFLS